MKFNLLKVTFFSVLLMVVMGQALFCSAQSAGGSEPVTFEGTLEKGEKSSAIIYVGMETGDVAAFCFKNASKAGRAILKVCKNGEGCKFTGRLGAGSCKLKDGRRLSDSGPILSVSSVSRIVPKKVKPAARRAKRRITRA